MALCGNGKGYRLRLTNAVPCFQRIVDDLIKRTNYEGTFAYLDNITIGGNTQGNTIAICTNSLRPQEILTYL